MHELPRFIRRDASHTEKFAAAALTNPAVNEATQFRHLIAYDDGHFRALFSPAYFVLQPGSSAPTKSQWNTLKKHLKRLDKQVFIFKEHGEAEHNGERCYYVDFGFVRMLEQ